MTAVHNHPKETAVAAARAALCTPAGRSSAELAGHILVLDFYGTEDEQAYARDFAEDMRHRDDLAIWLDIIMAPSKAAQLPQIVPDVPHETGWDVLMRYRPDWPMIAAMGVIGAGVAWLFLTGALAN